MSEPVALPPSDTELTAHVGRVLSAHYEVDREIGRGGMGIVYRARDRRLKRTVAIKLLPPEFAFRQDIRSRFLREAETAAGLSHQNIVPIYSVDEREGLVYFVMACIEGDNLARRLHDTVRLAPDETRRIVREVADALAYAHARGVVHRDIKPDNILLDRDTGRTMITDFGIARAAEAGTRLTATGMAIGTPAYMAPEQAAGEREVDGRTDLYSLGVVAYHMLAGELPFAGASPAMMLVKHLSEAPVPIEQKRDGLPADLARAVMMLLEKNPDDRFPSAGALAVALDTGNVPAHVPRAPTAMALAMSEATARASAGASRSDVGGAVAVQGSLGSLGSPPARASAAATTSDDLARWGARPVVEFRRKLAPYLAINFFFLLVSIFTGKDFFFVTAIWTVFIAWRYAKLWSDGFDWRDVFKQSRDRLLIDVVTETCDDTIAMFDPKKREALRARRREDVGTGGLRAIFESNRDVIGPSSPAGALPAGSPASQPADHAGAHAGVVQQAQAEHASILRLLGELPKAQRDALPDVATSAGALADKIRLLAVNLSELERAPRPVTLPVMDAEIGVLEGQANPFEGRASDVRVHRLKELRRQRRAVVDLDRRRDQVAARMETCRLALQNMSYDLLRLKSGAQSQQGVTTMAQQALDLARDVDGVIYAGDQLARLGAPRGSAGAAGGA